MKLRYNFLYFLTEGVRSIFTHGFMSFAAVCMIVCCLVIMGSFSLVAVNVDNMLGDLERDNEFLAYINEDYTTAQSMALKSKLEAVPNVASATFVSRESAMEAFLSDKDNDAFDGLPATVLRDRYRIHVVDLEQMEATTELVKAIPGVDKIGANLEVAQGFIVVRNVAGAVAVILVILLLIMSLFIIANTIKLATFNRREEIAIMKMCGATNSFIRWPFVVEGMLLGLAGALIAFLIQWVVYTLVWEAISTSDTISLITVLAFRPLASRVLGIFIGTGLVIGAGGSVLAIRKFLQV